MRISEVLAGKSGSDVVTIRPESSVRELVQRLAEHNVGALVVSTDGAHVDGIVSERDVVRRLAEDASVLERTVASIMSRDVHVASERDGVELLMRTMTDERVRHLPVVEDGTLRGIVSIGDLVKSRIRELEFERDQLDSYVHGG